MTARLIPAAARRRMPWKNGGGETFEVACWPPDGELTGFDWRISMAVVASDGPFSVFTGVDRTLAMLHGHMELAIEEQQSVVLGPASPPLLFRGEAAVLARLLDGPATDLNVMTRRDGFTHRLARIVLTAPLWIAPEPAWTFAICGRGQVRDDGGLTLSEQDTLVCDRSSGLALQPVSADPVVFLVRINPLRPG